VHCIKFLIKKKKKKVVMFEDTTIIIPSTRITLLVDNPITSLLDHPSIINKIGLPEIEIWRILDGTIAALKEL